MSDLGEERRIDRTQESALAVLAASFEVEDVPGIAGILEAVLSDLDAEMRSKSLRKLPYQDYLLSDHWKLTRRTALELAGYCCHVARTVG